MVNMQDRIADEGITRNCPFLNVELPMLHACIAVIVPEPCRPILTGALYHSTGSCQIIGIYFFIQRVFVTKQLVKLADRLIEWGSEPPYEIENDVLEKIAHCLRQAQTKGKADDFRKLIAGVCKKFCEYLNFYLVRGLDITVCILF